MMNTHRNIPLQMNNYLQNSPYLQYYMFNLPYSSGCSTNHTSYQLSLEPQPTDTFLNIGQELFQEADLFLPFDLSYRKGMLGYIQWTGRHTHTIFFNVCFTSYLHAQSSFHGLHGKDLQDHTCLNQIYSYIYTCTLYIGIHLQCYCVHCTAEFLVLKFSTFLSLLSLQQFSETSSLFN